LHNLNEKNPTGIHIYARTCIVKLLANLWILISLLNYNIKIYCVKKHYMSNYNI